MKTGYYLIIKRSSNSLLIDKTIFDLATDRKADPILWCRDGMFCLIPKEVIQNAIDRYEMSRQADLKVTSPTLSFVWNQGIPISNLAGRALVGE